MVENPERDERSAFDRMLKEWPSNETSDVAKAIMFAAFSTTDREGIFGDIAHQLERIADALEKSAK